MGAQMKQHMKESARGYATIFGVCVLVALFFLLVGRVAGTNPIISFYAAVTLIGIMFVACLIWMGRAFYRNQFGPAPTTTEAKFFVSLFWLVVAQAISVLIFYLMLQPTFQSQDTSATEIIQLLLAPAATPLIKLLLVALDLTLLAVTIALVYVSVCTAQSMHNKRGTSFAAALLLKGVLWLILTCAVLALPLTRAAHAYTQEAAPPALAPVLIASIVVAASLSLAAHIRSKKALNLPLFGC